MSTTSPQGRRRVGSWRAALGSVLLVGLVSVVSASAWSGGSAQARLGAAAPKNTVAPVVSGTPVRGETLSVTTGSWSGDTPMTFTYQWRRCGTGKSCVAIAGATGSTYTLTSADIGFRLHVHVTATNAAGSATAASNTTGVVTGSWIAPKNTVLPSITGAAVVGATLTASVGSWSGTAPISYAFAWRRCTPNGNPCAAIGGETSSSHLLRAADVGFRVHVHVTATNKGGSATAGSAGTAVVAANGRAPALTKEPSITGSAVRGQTLTATSGTWSGAKPITITYQWLRCDLAGSSCSSIAGATGATRLLDQGDVGRRLRMRVTAKNDFGTASADSNASDPVVEPGPPGAIPMPDGTISVPVTSLVPRHDHLLISTISFSPSPFRDPGGVFQARFRVVNEGTNQVIRGALVAVVGIPYDWIVQPREQPTGTDGWVTIEIRTTHNLPHTGALVMQVRARAPGNTTQAILGGISTRRLVQLPLR